VLTGCKFYPYRPWCLMCLLLHVLRIYSTITFVSYILYVMCYLIKHTSTSACTSKADVTHYSFTVHLMCIWWYISIIIDLIRSVFYCYFRSLSCLHNGGSTVGGDYSVMCYHIDYAATAGGQKDCNPKTL
jgi:hypothetical protein